MRAAELFRTAIGALSSNPLRSGLTTLGIIIGVASVITMVAVTEGARFAVDQQIAALGTNVLQVQTGSSRVRGRWAGNGTREKLSEGDIAALKESVPGIAAISGNLANVAPVVSAGSNWVTSIEGVNEQYREVRDWPLRVGRFFDESEAKSGRKVAVVGRTASQRLFGDQDPVGETIRIGSVPFEVIGALAGKGQSNSGRDLDDVILVPVMAARASVAPKEKLVPNEVGNLLIKVTHPRLVGHVKADVENVLRMRRKIAAGAEDDFFVRDLAAYVRTRTASQETMGLLLGATAAIALIVGGIGIMNIMLVSVTERTREIGLRMSVGAEPSDIMKQFLVESILLCALGGLCGVLIGIAATYGLSNAMAWPMRMSMQSIWVALSAAALTGMLFGFLPARKASLLDPIEALRRD